MYTLFFFLMIRRPPRSTLDRSSAASDVYKRQGNGYYIQPTVISNIKPDSRISLEEIFGPVLGIIKAKNFEDALKIANNTDYGLTGAVYSENDDKIKKAYNEFFVGNLYLNRKCTGALVGVHPFGGFNLSGTDSKAG